MLSYVLCLYLSVVYDGNLYVKLLGPDVAPFSPGDTHISLYKNGEFVTALPAGETSGRFVTTERGIYHAAVNINSSSITELRSRRVVVTAAMIRSMIKFDPVVKMALKSIDPHMRYDGVNSYFLQVQVKHADDIAKLPSASRALGTELELRLRAGNNEPFYRRIGENRIFGFILQNTFRLSVGTNDFDRLVSIADELNQLEYVIYCSVTPHITELATSPTPVAPTARIPGIMAEKQTSNTSKCPPVTPSFEHLQTYLLKKDSEGAKFGLNVRAAWSMDEHGRYATVRHLDYGLYAKHEDFRKNVKVVNSRSELEDCNHGTASVGVISAANNKIGVTGIAHEASLYFYDTDDLELIFRDAQPGDIVSLDIQFNNTGALLPMSIKRSWWETVRALNHNGVIVLYAGGNGGFDLNPAINNVTYYGNSGGIFVCACTPEGPRASFSNYNHPDDLLNAWGEDVVTTGYGTLQACPGNKRNYSNNYRGTSSATSMTSASVALIQSYVYDQYGMHLNARLMHAVCQKTGHVDKSKGNIGARPDVGEALKFLKNKSNLESLLSL